MKFRSLFSAAIFLFLFPRHTSAFEVPSQEKISQMFRFEISLKIPAEESYKSDFVYNKLLRQEVSLKIPAEWAGQDVYIDEYSPKPDLVQIGPEWAPDQQLIYLLPRTKEHNLVIKGFVNLTPMSFLNNPDLADKYFVSTLDDVKIKNYYINPSLMIESGSPEIKSQVAKLVGGKKKIYEIVSALYDYVVSTIDYDHTLIDLRSSDDSAGPQSALQTLKKGSGICADYSRLLIALLRAAGIPAREVTGIVDFGSDGSDGEPAYHSWVQMYVPKLGFIDIDPTWGEGGDQYIGDIDFEHIRWDYSLPDNEDVDLANPYMNLYKIPFWVPGTKYDLKVWRLDGAENLDFKSNVKNIVPLVVENKIANNKFLDWQYKTKRFFTGASFTGFLKLVTWL